ncbi:MAG: hypothetical protein KAS87_04915 [Candidatus Omnitrophica bacterium]|nr:hypothetical protein [Candidatus Omnitrophota bacterium]
MEEKEMEKKQELGDRGKELGGREEKEGSEKEIRGGAEKQGEGIPKKKKKWVKPTITRVKLNPEMAVMGVCSTSAGSIANSDPAGYCSSESPACRQVVNDPEAADAGSCDSEASS